MPGYLTATTANDATRPDITFSGNVPYISWQEEVSKSQMTFVGHFEGGASAPVFKLDTPTGIYPACGRVLDGREVLHLAAGQPSSRSAA